MDRREMLLQMLNETVTRALGFYRNIPDPDVMIYELWSARDIIAHLTFWHESFARNVEDLVNNRKPIPLKGRFVDLNQAGVDAMRTETLETILERFWSAQQTIREHILDPTLMLIPYKKGSRDYTPEEHLEIVDAHINQHMQDVVMDGAGG